MSLGIPFKKMEEALKGIFLLQKGSKDYGIYKRSKKSI